MKAKVLRDKDLSAEVEVINDVCWFTLQDTRTGKKWPRVPVLALEVYDRAQQRLDRLSEFRIDQLEAVGNGVHLVVGDRMRGIEVGLWIRLSGGELSVMLPP